MAEHTTRKSSPMLDPGTSAPRFRHRLDWTVWSESAFLVILILVFVATGFIPAWRHLNSDFPNYYLIARLHREGCPLERVYEWIWLQRRKDHRGIDQPLVDYAPRNENFVLVGLVKQRSCVRLRIRERRDRR